MFYVAVPKDGMGKAILINCKDNDERDKWFKLDDEVYIIYCFTSNEALVVAGTDLGMVSS